MTTQETKEPAQVSFVLGGLSDIPLIGVVFGIIAIVVGLATSQPGGKKLAAIGAGGIAFTVLAYSSLFYFGFVQRGGIYDDLRAKLAQSQLNDLVPAVEMYKLQHGAYPESLQVLQRAQPKDSTTFIFDPSDMSFGGNSRLFFYERVGSSHYYLRSVGADGKPFTKDDIVPQVSGSGIGLLSSAPK
jgi:Type II secretion system (T2SS), protein G